MTTVIKHLRAQYYEAPLPVQGFVHYHRSEQQIAGLWGTETCHPPRFYIPRHSHNLASFYLVLEGSLTEFYGRTQRDLGACNVVFTPPGKIHGNAFHHAGGRCFLVELTPPWMQRLRVEHASRQLVATNRPLGDVALAAGFADQAHFSRVFKVRTGLTPAKFRAAFTLR